MVKAEEALSPLTKLLKREGFKPFSGPHAFRLLEMAKERLNTPPVRKEDILKGISSLGVLLETEFAMLYAIQDSRCTKCGNCCRSFNPLRVRKEELKRIADHEGTSYKGLKRRLRAVPQGDGTLEIHGGPCPFLEGDLCSVYPVRPSECRIYPASIIIRNLDDPEGHRLPSDCPALDELLLEVLVKRVMEEHMFREEPELLREMAEERRRELAPLMRLPPWRRMRALVNMYEKTMNRQKQHGAEK